MTGITQIVLGPDGVVLAASGELSAGCIDRRLAECDGLPVNVRQFGDALLKQLRHSPDRLISASVSVDAAHRVEMVAIEALAIRRTAVDLRALLSSKLAVLFSQAADAGVTLRVAIAEDVPALVRLDAEKVAWSVTTLVGNALRYVRSGSRRVPGRTIIVRAAIDSVTAELTIEVQDDGPGIPSDTITRLFRRDGLNIQGAGLALLLTSDIVIAHGGKVEVRSSIDSADHGTTVRLAFPAKP